MSVKRKSVLQIMWEDAQGPLQGISAGVAAFGLLGLNLWAAGTGKAWIVLAELLVLSVAVLIMSSLGLIEWYEDAKKRALADYRKELP